MEKKDKFLDFFSEQQVEQIVSVEEPRKMCCLNRLPCSMESQAGSLGRSGLLHSAAVSKSSSEIMAGHH